MQHYRIHPCIAKLWHFGPRENYLKPDAIELRRKLRLCKSLCAHNVPWSEISEIVGISRSTYYRLIKRIALIGIAAFVRRSKKPRNIRQSKVSQSVIDLILEIRRQNPVYGKSKIVVILRRDHEVKISESTVGRILTKLILDGKVRKYRPSSAIRKRRQFDKHAKRLPEGMKGKTVGELVQIDHMTVTKNGISLKHFQAWDPASKVIEADVTANATSASAAKFLVNTIKRMPFSIKSIQVDGGSEFMANFETACQELNIPLFVTPPRKPQCNGGVERGNRIFREEFYDRPNFLEDTITSIRSELEKAVRKYNSYRPHYNLKGMTPYEYVAAHS